jgi:HEAT repeat protein
MKFFKDKFAFFITTLNLLLLLIIPIHANILIAEDDIAKIKDEIDSSDWQVRLSAVEKLAHRKDKEAINLLLTVAETRSEYWPVKIKAILLLGKTGNPKAKKLLLSIFNDPMLHWECPSIKTYTAEALGNFKDDPKVVKSLISALNDHEKLTREASIRSLGKIGDPEAVPHIIEHLKEDSFAIKIVSINALESIGDSQAILPLKQVAEYDTDSLIRNRAKEALNNLSRYK